jgi:hypothetical protein
VKSCFVPVRGAFALPIVSALLAAPACVTHSSSRKAHEEGTAFLAEGEYERATSSFQKAAALSADQAERTEALLGAGRSRLEAGEPEEALRILYEARRESPEGALKARTDHALGLAYLAQKSWAPARRYLEKGLSGLSSLERPATLARLSFSSRRLGDEHSARAFEERIPLPRSGEVEEILAGRDPLLLAAARSRKALDEGVAGALLPERSFPPSRRLADAPRPSHSSSSQLEVIPRSAWRPRPLGGNITRMGRVDKITIHHTAGDPFWDTSRGEVATMIRTVQKVHQEENKWADIGYHYIIDRTGKVWQGRPLGYQGAHAGGDQNRGNVGIALLGNYSRQRLSAVQVASLRSLVDKLCDYFGIPPHRVYTHQEIRSEPTECPGGAITQEVHALRAELRRRSLALGK